MNQNQTINQPESSYPVRVGHLSEVIAGSGFLLGDTMGKLCECGCGQKTNIRRRKPNRYINGHRSKVQPTMMESHAWKGGIHYIKGRCLVYNPKHPQANSVGYILRYRITAEKALGKSLPTLSVVHHIDGIKDNDNNDNIVICENDGYHQLLHQRQRAYLACGFANWRKCTICQQYDKPENLYIHMCKPKGGIIYHKQCKSIQGKKRYQEKKDEKSRQRQVNHCC